RPRPMAPDDGHAADRPGRVQHVVPGAPARILGASRPRLEVLSGARQDGRGAPASACSRPPRLRTVRKPSLRVVRTASPTVTTTQTEMTSHAAPAAVPTNTPTGTVNRSARWTPAMSACPPAHR